MIQFPLIPPSSSVSRTWCDECFLPNGEHDSLCSHTEVEAS